MCLFLILETNLTYFRTIQFICVNPDDVGPCPQVLQGGPGREGER